MTTATLLVELLTEELAAQGIGELERIVWPGDIQRTGIVRICGDSGSNQAVRHTATSGSDDNECSVRSAGCRDRG